MGLGLYDKRFYEFAAERWPKRWADESAWKACKVSYSKLSDFGIFDQLRPVSFDSFDRLHRWSVLCLL